MRKLFREITTNGLENSSKAYLFFLCLLFLPEIYAQKDTSQNKIIVIHSEYLNFETSNNQEYQYLRQEVVIRHKKTYLFCDSAIIVGLKVKAIGHVRIVEGDSLQIFGDTLLYDGQTLKAELRQNVSLIHHDKQLFTQQLNYDLKKRIASYFNNGILISTDTRIKSKKAYYDAKTEKAFFKDSVNIILNNGMNVQSDTIEFDSKKNEVQFLAPTSIKKDSLQIYCELGNYNVNSRVASFDKYPIYKNNSEQASARLIINNELQKITSLYENAQISDSVSTAKGDTIIINDSTNTVIIKGNGLYRDKEREIKGHKIFYNKNDKSVRVEGKTELIEGKQIIIADRIDYSGSDDIGYAYGAVIVKDTQTGWQIHCDTFSYNKKDKILIPVGKRKYISTPLDNDTLYLTANEIFSQEKIQENDTFQTMTADGDVRIWSRKIRGLCDSLFFHGKDSLFSLFYNPVLWSDTTQFTGDTILLYMKNKSIDRINLYNKSFILTESYTGLIDQIKGRHIFSYFKNKKIHYADVIGNAESVYYVQEDGKGYIGMNYIKCSKMRIDFFEDEKIDKIHFYTQPDGNMIPTYEGKDKRLEGFMLRTPEQPKEFEDLFKLK
ncbi:MAG: hypothetical protein HOP11_03725 [Saprospiraceae bacterium]|nr:hypothetical protein [Saprospiraceae bacterium]